MSSAALNPLTITQLASLLAKRWVADRVAWPSPSINGSHAYNTPRVYTLVPFIDTVLLSTNHLAKDLVDGCRLLQSALLDDLCPLLLHEQHEGIEGLLDVRLLLLYLLHGII